MDSVLQLVDKSSRYSGGEYNSVRKEWDEVSARFALIFPDLYEIGMSHQGLQILYHLINGREDLLAERAYAPDLDLEKVLRRKGMPLFSLESRRALNEFDVLGITLPYELCYTNILTILDLAGLPLRAAERHSALPLVIGGGPCAFHPEPVADFFDAILLGDGEEAVLEIAELIKSAKREGWSREEVLARLTGIEGIYVPAFFQPRYDEQGRFAAMEPRRPGYEKVRRRILPDLGPGTLPAPLVPQAKIVHDRLAIEIARGCTRGCRFCQAGVIYRPVRERSPARILEMAARGIASSGFEELALLSLSSGDYCCLPEVLKALMDRFAERRVSISMPSMRVGTLTPEIMAQIKRVRKTGFTLAPEAGTDRLRQVINKGITEEELLASSRDAFDLGWKLIKLYFMFGLPTECETDLAAIPELVGKVLRTAPSGNARVNVSVATFVPKPHTPFEREPQLGIAEGFARLDFLKKRLAGKRFNLKWHDPRLSFLEGVLCRGDRGLSALVEEAWRQGARFDAWSDHFKLDLWRRAADTLGLDLEWYLGRREPEAILPWQHLDSGVDPAFLKAELAKARAGVYTPDCRNQGCQQCGLCDFKTVKPVVYRPSDHGPAPGKPRPAARNIPAGRFRYRLSYARLGAARFPSHLETIRMFFRVFRRLELPLSFSEGFNPTPKVSFGPALPVGTESREEHLVMELVEPLADAELMLRLLNKHLPPGFEALRLEEAAAKETEVAILSCYHVKLPKEYDESALAHFRQRDIFDLSVVRKGKERRLDVKPMVEDLSIIEGGAIQLVLVTEPGTAAVKPLELLAAVLGVSGEETRLARIVKVWSRNRDESRRRAHTPAIPAGMKDNKSQTGPQCHTIS